MKLSLWQKVFLGMVSGVLVGVLTGPFVGVLDQWGWIKIPKTDLLALYNHLGNMFINAIKMLVVPLIFTSLIVGVTSLKDPKKMGRIGVKTFALYMVTTAIAISIGLGVGFVLQPGEGLNLSVTQPKVSVAAPSFIQTIVDMVPSNPIKAMASGDVLQIIVFAILIGISINVVGKKAKPVEALFEGFAEVMYTLTHFVMLVAPYGVFALMAYVAGQYGLSVLLPLLKVILGVYIAGILHMGFTMAGGISLISRLNPVRFFKGILDAQLVAFTTTSSSGTLPVTLKSVQEKLGVSKSVSSFVLPLGATINMDGTAIYQGVSVLFISQAYGVPLSVSNIVTIIFTSTLASIGTAGVPGAGLIMLTLVLRSVGLPIEGIAMVAGIDRILDMMRTVTNVSGDAMVSLFVAKSEGEFDEDVYYGRKSKESALS